MDMRSAGIKMSLLMGLTLSFFLSLTGLLSSGKFTLSGFVSSYIVSLVISLVIGFVVPMKKVSESLSKKFGIKERTLGARAFESLVSNIIYTPFISFCMVTLAYIGATRHGAHIPYLPMLLKSLVLTFIVGYLLIFTFMPIYFRICFKNRKE
ncbi:MAG: hypothetical protein J6A07_07110 [Firmicutes bacterium]|nr:hypothetical protein [Bacillota bacterium]